MIFYKKSYRIFLSILFLALSSYSYYHVHNKNISKLILTAHEHNDSCSEKNVVPSCINIHLLKNLQLYQGSKQTQAQIIFKKIYFTEEILSIPFQSTISGFIRGPPVFF